MMAPSLQSFLLVTLFATSTHSLPYLPEFEAYNLNQNKAAATPLEYWGEWSDHKFHPSPENWRIPFYSLFLDRFVNGEPSNDNSNKTAFEVDMFSTQLRVGGDISGLVDTLDYLQGMGIKVSSPSPSPRLMMMLITTGTIHRRQPLHQPAMVGRLFQSSRLDPAGQSLRHHR
jgi:alpha-1,3-glucan synthase